MLSLSKIRPHHLAFASAIVTFYLILIVFRRSISGQLFPHGVLFTTSFSHQPERNCNGSNPSDLAANASLGFEHILVLSQRPSWRTRGFQAAAKITGIEYSILDHPNTAPEFISSFQAIGPPEAVHPAWGSAAAWIAHIDLLKFVVASGFESVLIVEDDVDWDIGVKQQMRLVSDNVRNFTQVADDDQTPYGSNWDVMWIGHCGDVIKEDTLKHEYTDPSVVPLASYGGWTQTYVLELKENTRYIQKSDNPVCTFAYAINRNGARKVLDHTTTGQNEAFDTSLMYGCKSGKIDCITVNPELMHHYEPPKELGYVSEVKAGDGKGSAASETAYEGHIGSTNNILHSARCKALFNQQCQFPPS